MDYLLQVHHWYPPNKENLISLSSTTTDYWDLEPCCTIYDKMYRIFPERKEIDFTIDVKVPSWKYLDENSSIKLISHEDTPEVNRFLMEEYVFYNPLWKEYGVKNETETYKVYRDLLENFISEGNSLVAKSGQRIDGILLCNILDAGVGEVRYFDPKLDQVMSAEGYSRRLNNFLQLNYIRSWALIRLLQTGVYYTLDERLTANALLGAIWDWALVKGVDCVVAVNSSDKQTPVFEKNGYLPINAISHLHYLQDKQQCYDNVNFWVFNKTCFFVKFRNKKDIEMFNYTKGYW